MLGKVKQWLANLQLRKWTKELEKAAADLPNLFYPDENPGRGMVSGWAPCKPAEQPGFTFPGGAWCSLGGGHVEDVEIHPEANMAAKNSAGYGHLALIYAPMEDTIVGESGMKVRQGTVEEVFAFRHYNMPAGYAIPFLLKRGRVSLILARESETRYFIVGHTSDPKVNRILRKNGWGHLAGSFVLARINVQDGQVQYRLHPLLPDHVGKQMIEGFAYVAGLEKPSLT